MAEPWIAFVNGDFIEVERARVGALDAGLQHAMGLFETLGVWHGQAFRLEAHLRRLANSAAELGLSRSVDIELLAELTRETLGRNPHADRARLRITLTGGSANLLKGAASAPAQAQASVLIVPSPATAYATKDFEEGVAVLVAPGFANPFDPMAGHKTLNYWPRLSLLRQAAAAGAGEAIVLSVSNHLASGAVSNVFLVKDNVLYTPIAHGEEAPGSLPAPVLPGVTRAAVLELAQSMGLKTERRMLAIDDLLAADEVFLTNSSWLLLPVRRVEKASVADGLIGPVTHRLAQALAQLVEHETARPA